MGNPIQPIFGIGSPLTLHLGNRVARRLLILV